MLNFFKRKNRGEYLKYKEEARKRVESKLMYWNQFYNFVFNRVSIKNTKTRWGSCSSKKNLNFSYKVVYLTNEQLDYLIVHELCHLQEMNHSDRFWNLVAKSIPEYKKLRLEMRAFHLK